MAQPAVQLLLRQRDEWPLRPHFWHLPNEQSTVLMARQQSTALLPASICSKSITRRRNAHSRFPLLHRPGWPQPPLARRRLLFHLVEGGGLCFIHPSQQVPPSEFARPPETLSWPTPVAGRPGRLPVRVLSLRRLLSAFPATPCAKDSSCSLLCDRTHSLPVLIVITPTSWRVGMRTAAGGTAVVFFTSHTFLGGIVL